MGGAYANVNPLLIQAEKSGIMKAVPGKKSIFFFVFSNFWLGGAAPQTLGFFVGGGKDPPDPLRFCFSPF